MFDKSKEATGAEQDIAQKLRDVIRELLSEYNLDLN
jgi:hypothetical protein